MAFHYKPVTRIQTCKITLLEMVHEKSCCILLQFEIARLNRQWTSKRHVTFNSLKNVSKTTCTWLISIADQVKIKELHKVYFLNFTYTVKHLDRLQQVLRLTLNGSCVLWMIPKLNAIQDNVSHELQSLWILKIMTRKSQIMI